MKPFRISFFKKTDDDWYGNYKIEGDKRHPENMVEVSFMSLEPIPKTFRVCVWGDDDCGMEFDTPSWLKARQIFQDLSLKKRVNKEYLSTAGFVYT